jgi:quercetin dioxygenase-like cupin family protein
MDITDWDEPTRIDDLDGEGERRVLAATEEMMLVHYALDAGAEGAPHAHEETTQASFVIEGRLELLGEYSATVEAGDSYVIPPGTTHGVRALDACRVVDAFAPPLEQYRPDG